MEGTETRELEQLHLSRELSLPVPGSYAIPYSGVGRSGDDPACLRYGRIPQRSFIRASFNVILTSQVLNFDLHRSL